MKNKNLLFILFIIYFNGNAQTLWPLHNQSTQARVVGNYAEHRGTGRFHLGTDINNQGGGYCPGNVCEVRAINEGYVNGSGSGSTKRITIGDIVYIHCVVNQSVQHTQVNIGDIIGTMYSSPTGTPAADRFPSHIHLETPTMNYLNGNLDPFMDNIAPTLITTRFADGYKIYRNGVNRLSTNTQLTQSELNTDFNYNSTDFRILYGKIDIALDVEDVRVGTNGGQENTPGQISPYAYEYELRKFETPNDSIYNYRLTFNVQPDDTSASIDAVFHPLAHGDGAVNLHFITSSADPGTTTHDRYFNTRLRKGLTTPEAWPTDNIEDARFNGEAKYSDGIYRLHLSAYDTDHGSEFNTSISNPINEPIMIDNFLPYIEKVEILDSSNNIVSEDKWVFYNNALHRDDDLFYTLSLGSIGQTYSIRVFPSEKLTQLTLNAFNQNIAGTEYGFYWEFNLPYVYQSGSYQLSFQGRDIHNNQLLTNPVLLPRRLLNGTWPTDAVTGTDSNFYISLDDISNLGADFMLSCPGNKTTPDCLQACFQDTSTGENIVSWFWEFGDFSGSTSTEQNPNFTYDTEGVYDVTLTITNNENQISTKSTTIFIDCEIDIQADIISDITSGNAPETITFTDLSTGDVVNREWIVTDVYGNIITPQFVSGNDSSEVIQLLFNTEGIYKVKLELEDSFGSIVTSNVITINIDTQSGSDLQVDFDLDPVALTTSVIYFDALASNGCGYYQYQWTIYDYNGPHYSNTFHTSYSWSFPGTYNVELCVTDNCGEQVCITKTISVSNYTNCTVPAIGSSAEDTNYIVYTGEPVAFYDNTTNTSCTNIHSNSWYFEWDGNPWNHNNYINDTYPRNNPYIHTYDEAGTYTVKLFINENIYYEGPGTSITITVIDKPILNESHIQTFYNKKFETIQTKNFNGYLLTKTIFNNSPDKASIEIYQENANGDYILKNTLINDVSTHIDAHNVQVSGYKNRVAVVFSTEVFNTSGSGNPLKYGIKSYQINIYETTDEWETYSLKQTILKNGTYYERLGFGNFRTSKNKIGTTLNVVNKHSNYQDNPGIKLFNNNLIIGEYSYINHEISTRINLYEFGLISNEFELSESFNLDGLAGDRKITFDFDLNDDTIIVSAIRKAYNPDSEDLDSEVIVYKKNWAGWGNNIDDYLSGFSYGLNKNIAHGKIQGNIVVAAVEKSYNNVNPFPNQTQGFNLYENIGGNFYINQSKLKVKTHDPNLVNGFNMAGFPDILISNDSQFIVGVNSDYSLNLPTVKTPVFIKGNSWNNSRSSSDLDIVYSDGSRPFAFNKIKDLDIYDYKVLHLWYRNLNSVIYTFDLSTINHPNLSLCATNKLVDNEIINNLQQSEGARNITIQNTNINNGGGIIYKAVNKITIKPNTHIKEGSNFSAKIVDCEEIID